MLGAYEEQFFRSLLHLVVQVDLGTTGSLVWSLNRTFFYWVFIDKI